MPLMEYFNYLRPGDKMTLSFQRAKAENSWLGQQMQNEQGAPDAGAAGPGAPPPTEPPMEVEAPMPPGGGLMADELRRRMGGM